MLTFEPRVYVACLAAYGSGHLHGAWIDATLDPELMAQQIRIMMRKSPVPGDEYAFHDYWDFGKSHSLREYESLARVHLFATMLVKHGGAWEAYVQISDDPSEEGFEARYCGTGETKADWVEEKFLEDNAVPDALDGFVDYDAMARSWEFQGWSFERDSELNLHVFCPAYAGAE